MDEIIVKSQWEFDSIQDDFEGKIIIKFGTASEPAIINRRFSVYVTAWGNSTVEAWGNSTVTAWGNSTVTAWGNSQICDCGTDGKLSANHNARIVSLPKTAEEFVGYYGLKTESRKAFFYKSVHKSNGVYFSDYDKRFEYEIGKIKNCACSANTDLECSFGIHISTLQFALEYVSTLQFALEYGRRWDDVAILEVSADLSNVVVPKNSNGKARTSEITVIREVPLEECGALGKRIAKRRNKQ